MCVLLVALVTLTGFALLSQTAGLAFSQQGYSLGSLVTTLGFSPSLLEQPALAAAKLGI